MTPVMNPSAQCAPVGTASAVHVRLKPDPQWLRYLANSWLLGRTKITRAARWQAILAAGLLLAASSPRAELAGRFFFAPQERAALDGLRHNIATPGVSAAGGPITVNGLVTSSSGTRTVWINGVPQHESGQIPATKNKGSAGEITIRIPGSERQRRLKAGQTLAPGNGEIREGYQPVAPDTRSSTAPGGANSLRE